MADKIIEKRAKIERKLNSKHGTLRALEAEARETALGVIRQPGGSSAKLSAKRATRHTA